MTLSKKILLIPISLLIFAGCTQQSGQAATSPTGSNIAASQPSTPTSNTTTQTQTYTLSQVQSHASPSDCYMAIDGKVYDITSFVQSGMHPGGAVIRQGCGTDASQIFAQIHNNRARNMLNQYYISNLQQ